MDSARALAAGEGPSDRVRVRGREWTVEARIQAAEAQLGLLGDALALESGALRHTRQGAEAAVGTARAKYREAETQARLSAEQAERLRPLRASGYLAELDAEHGPVSKNTIAQARRAWPKR